MAKVVLILVVITFTFSPIKLAPTGALAVCTTTVNLLRFSLSPTPQGQRCNMINATQGPIWIPSWYLFENQRFPYMLGTAMLLLLLFFLP